MDRNRRRKGGFTLIELMVVVIIVGILAAVSVPIYRGQVRRAIAAEGKALMGSVRSGQLVYYAEKETFKAIGTATGYDSDIGVDATLNKYFTTYSSSGGATFTATTTKADDTPAGSGGAITVTITEAGVITTTPAGL